MALLALVIIINKKEKNNTCSITIIFIKQKRAAIRFLIVKENLFIMAIVF
jgi:hypothetical protein